MMLPCHIDTITLPHFFAGDTTPAFAFAAAISLPHAADSFADDITTPPLSPLR